MSVITTVIANAIRNGVGVVGVSQLAVFPILLSIMGYFHYDLFDPENRPINVETIEPAYDFVIVGGGSAGAVLANRLSEVSQFRVLLLEAGGHETVISDVPMLSLYLHQSEMDWKYRTEPQSTACQAMENQRCCWTRGKVIGGSSVLNTMLYVRGNRRDYDQWERLGNPGWGYDSVLEYFKKSEDQRNPYLAANRKYHGTDGYLTVQDSPYNTPIGLGFLQAGQEMGYDILDSNGETQTGFSLFQYNMRRGSRCSTSKAFLRPVRLRPNLHVALYTHVIKVQIDATSKQAYGVQFIRNHVIQNVLASKEVILSAGAINSPQLLMLSGIGPHRHLTEMGVPVLHSLPGVGQNLQDHIAIGGILFTIDHPVSIVMNRLVNINTAFKYAFSLDGPLSSSAGIETAGFITTKRGNMTDDWPDIEFMLTSSSTVSDGGTQVKKAHCITDHVYDSVFRSISNRDAFVIYPMILRPRSRGHIRLRSKNPLAYPILQHNYLTDPEDRKVLVEGCKAAVALGKTRAMRRFGAKFHRTKMPNCRQYDLFTDAYWYCYIKQYTMTIYHMSGTCRMGDSRLDPNSVVDHELRVYGVKGLRVIDASIMPRITSGNINAPVIMIAEKGADMIKQFWLENRTLFPADLYK